MGGPAPIIVRTTVGRPSGTTASVSRFLRARRGGSLLRSIRQLARYLFRFATDTAYRKGANPIDVVNGDVETTTPY